MYDYLVAALRCPACGAVSPATSVTGMQTHLRDDADGSKLAVGYLFDPGDLETKHVLDSGYRLIAPLPSEGTMRLLEVWTCPTSATEEWALIEIVNFRIERIEAVRLNRATLEAANFISAVNADLLAEALSGLPATGFFEGNLNSVDALRQRLE